MGSGAGHVDGTEKLIKGMTVQIQLRDPLALR